MIAPFHGAAAEASNCPLDRFALGVDISSSFDSIGMWTSIAAHAVAFVLLTTDERQPRVDCLQIDTRPPLQKRLKSEMDSRSQRRYVRHLGISGRGELLTSESVAFLQHTLQVLSQRW